MIVAVSAAIGLLAAAMPQSPLLRLAGRYTHRFKNGDIDGGRYYSIDVVEIFPLDRRRALVSLELNFFNGHSCAVFGEARLEGSALVYRDKSDLRPDEAECSLKLWRDRADLRWEDDGTCQFHCGSRGGLSNGRMPAKTRQVMKGPPTKPSS
jgi:hypothetical protein